jgi:hypothetical protein
LDESRYLTDVVQFFIHVVGGLAALCLLAEFGGWGTVTSQLGDIRFSIHLPATTTYTSVRHPRRNFPTLASHGTDQLMAAMLAAPNLRASQRALIPAASSSSRNL